MKKALPVFLSTLIASGIVVQTAPFAYAAPYEVYSRIEVSSADYYLDTDIDEFGNARIFPSKTTFSPTDAVSGATTLAQRFTLRADYGTNAAYVYAIDRAEGYRDWADKITKVSILSYDWEELIRKVPSELGFEETDTGLVLKTKALEAGVYTVRIYSEGSDTFTLNLDIQKPAPKLVPKTNPMEVTQKASFTLEGLGFSWKSAVYEVQLNGKVLATDQYSVISDLLTLQAGVLTQSGTNTLKVKSYGYHDADYAFTVNGAKAMGATQVMALSGATSGGSSGGSGGVDGVSGATGTVPAFLTFKFDLLANAEILKDQGMETQASKGVLKWWDDSNKEVVRGEGTMKLYDWEDFVNSGKSFEDHVASGGKRAVAADGIFWDMWETKNVLENGKLGDPYDFYEQIAEPHPIVTVESADWKTGVTLVFADVPDSRTQVGNWKDQIAKVPFDAPIYVGSTGLYGDEYQWIEDNKLFLPPATLASRISEGDTLSIRSSGYKTIHQKITFATGTYEPALGSETYAVGDSVEVKNLPKDIKGISVKLGDKSLNYGDSSGLSNYFTLEQDGEQNKLVVNAANFADSGTYFIKIKSTNYAQQTVKVKVQAAQPTYRLGTVSDVTFEQVEAGYSSVKSKQVSIKNTGNQTLTNVKATLSDGADSKFELSTANQTLEPGKSTQITVRSKTGLAEGSYSDTVTISADNAQSVSFKVAQEVVAAKPDDNTGNQGDQDTYPLGSEVVIKDIGFDSEVMVEITVNGTRHTNPSDYNNQTKTLTLPSSLFKSAGDYKVKLTGFMATPWEKTIKVVAGSNSGTQEPAEQPGTGTPAETPETGTGENGGSNENAYPVGQDIVIKDERVKTKDNIYITINGVSVSSSASDYKLVDGSVTFFGKNFPTAGEYKIKYGNYSGSGFEVTVTVK